MSSAEAMQWDEAIEAESEAVREEAAHQDPVRQYLNEIGRTPLLSAVEEVELAKRIESGVFAQAIRDVRNPETREATLEASRKNAPPSGIELLTKLALTQVEVVDDEGKVTVGEDGKPVMDYELTDEDLADLIKDGAEAKTHMTEANLRLAANLAKRYTGRNMKYLDLIQEGNLGVIRAVEKFDYTKGFKFSTYSTWWIRQSITRSMADQARTIRIPVHMVELINKTQKTQRELLAQLGREATPEELAAEMDTSVEKVRDYLSLGQDPVSLDMQVGDDADSKLGDFITDDSEMSPVEDQVVGISMNEALEGVLATVDERSALVIRMRYGLLDGTVYTLDQIGAVIGVSRERVRQIERVTMEKLRNPSRSQNLSAYRDGGVGAAVAQKAPGRNNPKMI